MTDEKNTQETLKDGWIHTGDVAEVDPQGRFKIIDRIKVSFLSYHGRPDFILHYTEYHEAFTRRIRCSRES
jgi:acyl-CoA synthetase (AMP-forming)/AMP-acid ligase II